MSVNNNKAVVTGTSNVVNAGKVILLGAALKDPQKTEKEQEKGKEKEKGKGEEKKEEKKDVCESSELARLISVGINEIYLPAPGSNVSVEIFSSTDSTVIWHAHRTSDMIEIRPTAGIIEAFGSTEVRITARRMLNHGHHRVSIYTALKDNSEDLPEEKLVLPVVTKIPKAKEGKKKEGKKKND